MVDWAKRGNDCFLEVAEKHRLAELEKLERIKEETDIEESLLYQRISSKRKARMKNQTEMKKLGEF